jgi:hypothetical protein
MIWPFPRLRYWLRHGHWCEHEWLPGDGGRQDGWRMIDLGRKKMRTCHRCDHSEFVGFGHT